MPVEKRLKPGWNWKRFLTAFALLLPGLLVFLWFRLSYLKASDFFALDIPIWPMVLVHRWEGWWERSGPFGGEILGEIGLLALSAAFWSGVAAIRIRRSG